MSRHYLRLALLCFALFLACMALVNCAPSLTGKALNIGVMAAGTADVVTTLQGLERGAVEANPIMRPFVDAPWKIAAVKSASTGGIIALADWVEQDGHPRWAHFIRSITIASWGSVAAHNTTVMR